MNGPLLGPAAPPSLHVMSFNARRPMNGITWPPSDRWASRRARMEALLGEERPTILGAQEVLPAQAAVIRAALGPSYRFVGHGRLPGPRGEACPIFYDEQRLDLLSWRQRALSDRPDEPGSTSWGNLIPRVFVQAVFRDRMTSREFTVVNTHLDVFSARARQRGARELHRIIADQPLPAILLGDLNSGPTSAPWTTLLDREVLKDAWATADARLSPEWATFAGYRRPRRGKRIDAILVSPGVQVRQAAINGRRFDGGWPSDHLPLQAHLLVPAGKGTR